MRRLFLGVLVLTVVVLLGVGVSASIGDSSSGTDGDTQEPLVGEALADDLALILHEGSFDGRLSPEGVTDANGDVLADCVEQAGETIAVQEVSGGFYCVPGETEVEAWALATRIAFERVPSQAEMDEMEENLADPSEDR